MDEFIRKKILYFLKYKYDKNPYDIVDLLKYFESEVSVTVIERNILYLSKKHLVEHHDTQGNDNVLANITDEGIEFVEEDLKNNYEINLLEFMSENLEKKQDKLKFNDFPEYLFPDRAKLNANLLKYDKSEVAVIHDRGVPREVRLVFLKSTLINRLEDLKIEKEFYKSSLERQTPVMNITHIKHMESSQFQQGTINSTQRGTFNINHQKELAHFIELLKDKLPKLGIAEDDKPLIEADIKTVEAQIESGRPDIVKERFLSIQRILGRAGETIITSELLHFLPSLLDIIKKYI